MSTRWLLFWVMSNIPKMGHLPTPAKSQANPKQQPFPGPPSYSRWSLFVSTILLVFQRSPWQDFFCGGPKNGRNAPFLPPLLQINAICFSVKCPFLMELMSWRGWNAHSTPHGRQYQYVMLPTCIPPKNGCLNTQNWPIMGRSMPHSLSMFEPYKVVPPKL